MINEISRDIIVNSVFLLTLVILYYFYPKNQKKYTVIIKTIVGITMGVIGVFIMETPIMFEQGIIVDSRSVFLSVGAVFFGFVPAVISMGMMALYRYYFIGGEGMLPGVILILSSTTIGLIYRYLNSKVMKEKTSYRPLDFLILSYIVHIVYFSLFFMLDGHHRNIILMQAIVPVLVYLPAASVSLLVVVQLVHENYTRNKQLIETQNQFVLGVEGSPVPIAIHREDGTVITYNKAWRKRTGYTIKNAPNVQIFAEKAFKDRSLEALDQISKLYTMSEDVYRRELRFYTSKNKKVDWDFYASLIGTDTKGKKLIMSIANDITEQKKLEKELTNLSFKDRLTGLYNRRFFEEEFIRLNTSRNYPLSLVYVDVNSLKLTNDAFGHDEGDKLLKTASKAFKAAFRSDDIIARVGGDEFVVILPKTEGEICEKLIARVNENLKGKKIKNIPISLAIGYYTSTNQNVSLERLYKLAEESMYQEKLHMSKDVKEKAVNVILNTLFRRDKTTKEHSENTAELLKEFAISLKMEESKVEFMRKTGYLHDIGKIVMHQSLLKKQSGLDEIERIEIRKHPETGYRILNNGYNMQNYASIILDHHERWDGAGYPQKKRGLDISLEARMLAICDSFSAMINVRPYRKNPLTITQAIDELVRNKGFQFDPELVDKFIEGVVEKLYK